MAVLFVAPAAHAARPEFSQKPTIKGSGHAGDRLTCSWSFANPGDVTRQESQMVAVKNGSITAILKTGSGPPLRYTPKGDEGSVGCRVRATGRAEGDAEPPTAQAVSPIKKIRPRLVITGRGMKPQTIAEIERTGFAAQGECNRRCALTLRVVLGATDSRRLGLGRTATTIASGKGPSRLGKSSVRARVAHLAKLNRAGFVHITLFLGGVGTDGERADPIILTKMKIRFHN